MTSAFGGGGFDPFGGSSGPSREYRPDGEYDAQGQFYEYINGQWVRNSTFDDPTKAAGYQAPRQGPSATEIGNLSARWSELEEAKRQFDLNYQQQLAAFEEQLKQNAFARVMAGQEFAFLKDKFAVETEMGNKRLALDTQAQMFNQQATLRQLEFQGQQIVQQAMEFNARAQQEAAMFNAQMQMSTDVENQRRLEAQQERRRNLARDIGLTAQDAGSRGRLAAELLANPGLGELDAKLAEGQNFFTDESLFPLGNLLGQREDAAKAPNFLTFNPVQAAQVAVPNFQMNNFLRPPMPQQDTGPMSVPVAAGLGGPATADQMSAQQSAQQTAANQGVATAVGKEGGLWEMVDGNWVQHLPQMEHGGHAEGAFIAGDSSDGKENREVVIPLGPGEAMVIPEDAFLSMGGKRKQMAKMQDGGLFSEGTIFGQADLSGTRENTDAFLTQALRRALSDTPWQQQGRAPTPVELSAPGTAPLVQELGGSLSSLAGQLPMEEFLRRARMMQAPGIQGGPLRRTAVA